MTNHRPHCVLYIEDDRGVARLFQKKLEQAGYVVDLVFDGESGLAMYNADHHDLIALDQNMPGYSGLDVIRLLAERGPLPPILMITGAGDEQIAVQAMKLGAGDYLVKDIDGRYLELAPSVIDQLLRQQRLIRERQEALEALERSNGNLALLNGLGQALSAMLNPKQIIRELLWATADIVGAQGSSIWIGSDEDSGEVSCQGVFGHGEVQDDLSFKLAPSTGLVGQVMQNVRRAIASPPIDVDRYPDIQAYTLKVTSLMAVPLWARNTVIGVLQVANKIQGDFEANDTTLLETLAFSAAIALDNARLVETLRRQTHELQMQNEDLEAFSHSVAHDLKNPVGVIEGFNFLLMDQAAARLNQQELGYLEYIDRTTRKINNIIDELLRLAEIRKRKVEPQLLDLSEIVAEAEERLSSMIKEYEAQIIFPSAWPAVLGYAPWVEEVWVNYLSNALKYGGQPPVVEVGSTPLQDGTVRLWVKDNGPGLTSEQRAQLFAPFTRLQQVRADGHGLGLSIVRRIVEKLGGQVGVESMIGQGSIFSFTLPRPLTLAERARTSKH
ncbi:MAG: response regulator [Chloroflexi bacterium]|nr:response regulator [Chloroflexota bacterium]